MLFAGHGPQGRGSLNVAQKAMAPAGVNRGVALGGVAHEASAQALRVPSVEHREHWGPGGVSTPLACSSLLRGVGIDALVSLSLASFSVTWRWKS